MTFTVQYFAATSRYTVKWPPRHAALPDMNLITDYHKNESFPPMKCIRRYVYIYFISHKMQQEGHKRT